MNILFPRERLTCFSQARSPDLRTCRSPQPRQRGLWTLGCSSERCTNLEERENLLDVLTISRQVFLFGVEWRVYMLSRIGHINKEKLMTEKNVLLYLDKKVNSLTRLTFSPVKSLTSLLSGTSPPLYRWNDGSMAFTATATGPTLATTAFRVSSSPRGRMWKLEQEPAFPWTEYRHFPFCKTETFLWSWCRWGQAWISLEWNNDLVLVRIKALRVHASVADDVVVGFGDVASPAAQVTITGAAVHQVLRAQGNEEPGFLLHLTLQSSQRAEGPAGATITLRKRPHFSWSSLTLSPFVAFKQPTWFWTGLTRPSFLQSTLGGVSKSSLSSKVPFQTGTRSSTFSLFIFSLISSAVLRDKRAAKHENSGLAGFLPPSAAVTSHCPHLSHTLD